MDTEKYLDTEHKIRMGESPNDEGPFYHHGWWESYKGSIKGKLGGAVIGLVIGAVVGGVAAVVLALATPLAAPVIGLAFAALTGAGMIYGAHEFSEIGKIQGSVAAGLEQVDAREAIRFSALEQKVDALTNILKNRATPAEKIMADNAAKLADKELSDLENYRVAHYAQLKPDSKNRYVFWKVAAIGLAVGVAAGVLLASGGQVSAAAHILETFGMKAVVDAGSAAITAASAVIFGLFGASFGINRDIFRKTFDTTDLWVKGILRHGKMREHQVAAGKLVEKEHAAEEKAAQEKVATAVAYDNSIDYPASSTHYRDKVLASAEKALLSFDHTRATPQ